ncbi:MAG: sulfite exporter TauE/SafE family protein [Bacteroidales bacterium]|nr:sulfite exporter TauE/SafE family protein [Bacteroidales bacterium]
MTPLLAVLYSFLFGLLHGILPDEHTWPITFSYAIAGASGKEGIKAGLYFSAAFTVQRALLSEVAYLALAPFLLSPTVNGIVYIVVGVAMSVAGAVVLKKNLYPHLHLIGHHHEEVRDMKPSLTEFTRHHKNADKKTSGPPPARWTIIHGFIAGFGFGGFSLFVNTVAAPAMHNAWLGFIPGLVFGLGTMIMLVIIGYVFGAALRWTRLSEQEIKRVGAHTGGRTLFFGGILFVIFGIITLFGLDSKLPFDPGYLLIGIFMLLVAMPAFFYTWKEVVSVREK